MCKQFYFWVNRPLKIKCIPIKFGCTPTPFLIKYHFMSYCDWQTRHAPCLITWHVSSGSFSFFYSIIILLKWDRWYAIFLILYVPNFTNLDAQLSGGAQQFSSRYLLVIGTPPPPPLSKKNRIGIIIRVEKGRVIESDLMLSGTFRDVNFVIFPCNIFAVLRISNKS